MSPELQATYQILSLFERSKAEADRIFDALPGIFVHCDVDGRILRANQEFSASAGVADEDILNSHFSQLFASEVWAQFREKLGQVKTTASVVEFELPIKSRIGESVDYHWQVRTLNIQSPPKGRAIITCLGRDVSLVKKTLAKVVSLKKDLEVTSIVQNLLLPVRHEIQSEAFDLAVAYKPAETASGDYWWIEFIEDKVWILVGDVTGHGAGPAMVTAMVSGCVQTLVALRNRLQVPIDLPVILAEVDHQLSRFPKQPYWMAVSAIELDCSKKMMRWWSATSPPILSLPSGGGLGVLTGESKPLGTGDAAFACGEMPLSKGQRIVILTDGLTEAKNEQESQFGQRRLVKCLSETRALAPEKVREELLGRVDKWRGGAPPDDDSTIVILDWL